MNSTVKTSANAARNHAHASQPTLTQACTIGACRKPAARDCAISATPRNVPNTKTEMNVVSLVAKLSASSAPISAGWWRRGRSRKRKVTTSSASVMQAK